MIDTKPAKSKAVIEILTLTLKPGTRDKFHQLYVAEALPLLKKWKFQVVAHGPSRHDENSYYVIRSFKSLEDRQKDEEAYYSSDDWRNGPRTAMLAMIEHEAYIVVSPETLRDSWTSYILLIDCVLTRSIRRQQVAFASAFDGTRLYLELVGMGEPLLLVAGRNSDHHLWNVVRGDFAKHYQVIVYDQRGTGQSDKPEAPPYSTRIFARDAVSILDHLHIPRAHAYGVSMGGAICQWLNVDYPARLQTLVLACSTAGRSHGISPSLDTKAIMSGEDSSRSASLLFSKPIGLNKCRFYISMGASNKYPMPSYTEELHKRASEQHDVWELLPSITTPTLVIPGSDDPVCPRVNADLLAERIPRAELYFFSKGRHMFFIEFRHQVNKLILDFLSRHPISRT